MRCLMFKYDSNLAIHYHIYYLFTWINTFLHISKILSELYQWKIIRTGFMLGPTWERPPKDVQFLAWWVRLKPSGFNLWSFRPANVFLKSVRFEICLVTYAHHWYFFPITFLTLNHSYELVLNVTCKSIVAKDHSNAPYVNLVCVFDICYSGYRRP